MILVFDGNAGSQLVGISLVSVFVCLQPSYDYMSSTLIWTWHQNEFSHKRDAANSGEMFHSASLTYEDHSPV